MPKNNTLQTLAELEAQREALKKQIRDARRQAKAEAAEALREAHERLGRRLAKAAGATTAEAVDALAEALDLAAVTATVETGHGDTEETAEAVSDDVETVTVADRDEAGWPGPSGTGGWAG